MTDPTTHIPGPWSCSQESADPEWWIVTIPGGLIVANVNAHHRQEANARLISAAPELLDCLKMAEDVLSRHPFSTEIWRNGLHPANGVDMIRTAIAKATGTS
jgi:hypothetical protein